MRQICSLLLLFIFVSSCKGQNRTFRKHKGDRDSASTQKAIVAGQPKIVRTQNLQSGNITAGFQDKEGNLWFGSGGEGVYRYGPSAVPGSNVFTNFTEKDGLNSNYVYCIIEDKAGNILFGTLDGVCKFDGRSFTNFTENKEVNNSSIWSLLEDKDGNLWLGTKEHGVFRYDLSATLRTGTQVFTNFLNNDDHPFNLGEHYQAISDILQDKKGNIWFSSFNGGGVWRYNASVAPGTGSDLFTNYLPSADYYSSDEDGRSFKEKGQRSSLDNFVPKRFTDLMPTDRIHDDMIFSIAEDKAGNLWFGTRRHGACRYDGKSFTSFREKEGFVSPGILSVLEDKKGNIWLGTDDSGVWCYDGKSFKNYTMRDGLVSNSVFSILEDNDGNLWFGTRQFGLSRYDGETFTAFSEKSADE